MDDESGGVVVLAVGFAAGDDGTGLVNQEQVRGRHERKLLAVGRDPEAIATYGVSDGQVAAGALTWLGELGVNNDREGINELVGTDKVRAWQTPLSGKVFQTQLSTKLLIEQVAHDKRKRASP